MRTKTIAILLSILLVISMTACSQAGNPGGSAPPQTDTNAKVPSEAVDTSGSAPTQADTNPKAPSQAVNAGGSSQAQTDTKPKATTQVVDAIGRTITIPEVMKRIAITCNGGTTQEASIFGAADKIVAQPPMNTFPQLLKIYPDYKNIINPGTFDNVNVEEIIKADPNVVLVGISSPKGNKLIEDAGFPTFTMYIGWASVKTLKNEFVQIGTLLGNKAKAEELVNYWNKKTADINSMVSKVPINDRKKVLYVSVTAEGVSSVHGTGVWGDDFIKSSGSLNAADVEGSKQVNAEQILMWDPDLIIVQKDQKANAVEKVMKDPKIGDLKAIRGKQVYQVPIGAFWWDRPSPESPLAFMWLAKLVYPEYTKEIDLKKETKEFFKTFYNYDLSDAEYDSFF